MSMLKLYIWDKFVTSYSDGLAFAIAESEDEARALVTAKAAENFYSIEPYEWGPVTVHNIEKIACCVPGGD